MLNNAFSKFDRNGDGKLNAEEFKNFNETLKPGIALDKDGHSTVDYSTAMDQNSDKMITRDEMNATGVLMPTKLTDDSLKAMFDYLLSKGDSSALAAAATLRPEAERQSKYSLMDRMASPLARSVRRPVG
jgi:Ca2+-binding EF-hand superfamily protein